MIDYVLLTYRTSLYLVVYFVMGFNYISELIGSNGAE